MHDLGDSHEKSLWPVVLAVTATYAYFLLFAEFGFLSMVSVTLGTDVALPWVMGALGLGGILGSAGASWHFSDEKLPLRLSLSFGACGVAAGLALCARERAGFVGVAVAIGLALGWNTVTLAAGLRTLVPREKIGRVVGLGTGLAYALCNVPVVFTASARVQTWLCFLLAGVGALVVRKLGVAPVAKLNRPARGMDVFAWTVVFMALVWLDSGAFYIVQHTASLREGTWEGTFHLWSNAIAHLSVAVAAGLLLDRGGLSWIVMLAWVGLAAACVAFDHASGLPGLNLIYVGGVSLYSTAFVFFVARDGRPWVASVVFAVAGWMGSAFGIGMVRDLQRVPWLFIAITGIVVAAGLGKKRIMPVALVVLTGLLAVQSAQAGALTAFEERGRQVYIAEGCIHCHSQYIRPQNKTDLERWGPARTVEDMLREQPPLPGNRRQGPDLSNVGNRRSLMWNQWHLIAPRQVSPGSRMPSYRHLFAGDDERGVELLAYLSSLGAETLEARQNTIRSWLPVPGSEIFTVKESKVLFMKNCAQCHGSEGTGDGRLMQAHGQQLPDWKTEKWRHVSGDDEVELARLIKFGLPGTLMAGHESSGDAEILALARYVKTLHR